MTDRVRLGLTLKQHRLLTFVRDYIGKNGYSPALAEMAAAFSCSEPNISRMLNRLEARGAIVRNERYTRSVMPAA